MTTQTVKIIVVTCALIAGNFFSQAVLPSGDYAHAVERSIFQIVAVFTIWMFALRGEK